MSIEKLYSFSEGHQIWRIQISSTDKLLIETRDLEQKEVRFSSLNLNTGEEYFKGMQPDEKFWIGIEAVCRDSMFLHYFQRPDMPLHQGISVRSLVTGQMLWENRECRLLFLSPKGAFSQSGDRLLLLNSCDGSLIKDYGTLSEEELNSLRNESQNNQDYSDYAYPVDLGSLKDQRIKNWLNNKLINFDIEGEVQVLLVGGYLLSAFHAMENEGLAVYFIAFNLENDSEILRERLNKRVNAVASDLFFMKGSVLLLMKEKTELIAFRVLS